MKKNNRLNIILLNNCGFERIDNKRVKAFFLSILFLLVLCVAAGAKSDGEDAKRYILLFKTPPVYEVYSRISRSGTKPDVQTAKKRQSTLSNYAHLVRFEQDSAIAQIRALDSSIVVGRRFDQLINGCAVTMNPELLDTVKQMPDITGVYPNGNAKLFMTEPDQMMSRMSAWSDLGGGDKAGEGMIIALLDTGIDHTHPALDGAGYEYPEGFPKGDAAYTNKKIIVARSFPPTDSTGVEDTEPWDREGHGTNVATISAANYQVPSPLGLLSGIAPRAYLANYKVFTNANGAGFDQILAALEQAVADGCDVINMSLGVDYFLDTQQDPMLIGIRNATRQGVIVVAAAGNTGLGNTVGGVGQSEYAITAGSIRNTHSAASSIDKSTVLIDFYLNGDKVMEGVNGRAEMTDMQLSEPYFGTFPLQDVDLMDGGDYGGAGDGLLCEDFSPAQKPEGWLLVQRGACTFTSKAEQVLSANGKGVLFYDNAITDTHPSMNGSALPGILIDKADGQQIKQILKDQNDGQVSITVYPMPAKDQKITGGSLSSFSSAGPGADFLLKPDLVAVGEGSYAGLQNVFYDEANIAGYDISGFGWMAGTSMSCPRISGLAALVRSIHTDWPVEWIKSAMQLSAVNLVPLKPGGTTNSSLLQRGAGRADALGALETDTIALPVLINFGIHLQEDGIKASQWVTVINPLDKPCSYSLSLGEDRSGFPITFSMDSFTVNPKQKVDIELVAAVNSDVPVSELDQRIVLKNQTTGKSYSLQGWMSILANDPATGTVLLVDDDEGKTSETYYKGILDQLKVPYTVWDVNAIGKYPVLANMKPFRTTVWFMRAKSLNTLKEDSIEFTLEYNGRHAFQSELARYLNEGGSLFLSGEDYIDKQETSAFTAEVLGVELSKRDNATTLIQGYPGNELGDSFGSGTLKFPSDLENLVDEIKPIRPGTAAAFYANSSRVRRVGVTVDTCNFRAVYITFPLETLSAVNGTTILKKSLQWFNEKQTGTVAVSGILPAKIDLDTDSPPYLITIRGDGFTYLQGYDAMLDLIPIQNLKRIDCQTLTGEIPENIKPGNYTLHVTTGDVHRFTIPNAFSAVSKTGVGHWQRF